MKIASVKAQWLHVPISEEHQHVTDFGRDTSFDCVLVEVRTDCGLTGYGEAKAQLFSSSSNHALCAMIEREQAPHLIGEDPRDVVRLWDTLYNGSRAHIAISRGQSVPVLGRRGLTLAAISGIDMALWDILGRSLNVPVWRLLGGRRQERLPAYASGGWAAAERIADELRRYIEIGNFQAVKMRVGAGDGTVANSVRRVRAAREGLGEEIDIMCDAHGTMTVAEAKRFCREVADCSIAWLEEPVSVDDHQGLAEVRRNTDIPIAAGESEYTRFDFLELAQLRAVDIFQPDLAVAGGITEAVRIGALASAHHIRFSPHLWGSALSFAAGLHVAATCQTSFILEYCCGANPLLHDLAVEDFSVSDGYITIPDRPGLGVTINEEFRKEYVYTPE